MRGGRNCFKRCYLVSLSLVILILATGAVFCTAATKEKKIVPQLTIVAPPDGAFVTEGTLFLSGVISDLKVKSVKISGTGIKVAKGTLPVSDGTFGSLITFRQIGRAHV